MSELFIYNIAAKIFNRFASLNPQQSLKDLGTIGNRRITPNRIILQKLWGYVIDYSIGESDEKSIIINIEYY
jgi:hypothetical protein